MYSCTNILVKNQQCFIKRNRNKRDNLGRLCTKKYIHKIPYRVFYMSCNLEHVLYDLLNLSDEEKHVRANKFAMKYKNNVDEFLDFIAESNFSVKGSYSETWSFLKQNNHSLERYSNLGICLKSKEIEKLP